VAYYTSLPDSACPESGDGCVTADSMATHFETIDVPLAGAQFFICLIIVYLLVVNTRIMSNMIDKDDPFTNGYLMAMLIFYIDMQRVFFKIFGMLYFINK